MVRKDPVKIVNTPNYTKKTVTIRPDKDNELFTFSQIKKYCEDVSKTLSIDDKMVVKGLNILKDSTLKGYDDNFISDEDWNDYSQGKVKDSEKFNNFYNFTITIRSSNNVINKNIFNKN